MSSCVNTLWLRNAPREHTPDLLRDKMSDLCCFALSHEYRPHSPTSSPTAVDCRSIVDHPPRTAPGQGARNRTVVAAELNQFQAVAFLVLDRDRRFTFNNYWTTHYFFDSIV